MQQQNIPIGTLVDMYKRGEMRRRRSSATTSGGRPAECVHQGQGGVVSHVASLQHRAFRGEL